MANSKPKPNLIFAGLKLGLEPIEFFNNGKRVNVAPVDAQIKDVEVEKKDKDGKPVKTTERVALPFYHDDPALVVRSTRAGRYKLYDGESNEKKV
jgi:hypothetical protein